MEALPPSLRASRRGAARHRHLLKRPPAPPQPVFDRGLMDKDEWAVISSTRFRPNMPLCWASLLVNKVRRARFVGGARWDRLPDP